MYTHVTQKATNRLLKYSGNQGTIQRIFLKKFLSEDVAQLFEYAKDVVYRAKRPLVSYLDFTLVNVCSPIYRFSHGYCPPPPKSVVFPASSIVLTFALHRKYYTENCNVAHKAHYQGWAYLWSENKAEDKDYFTVSIPMYVVDSCHIKAVQYSNVYYLYNVLSMLFKTWITHLNAKPFLRNMYYNKSRLYNITFGDLVNYNTIYHIPYNLWVWQHATNLITVDYNVALYFFMYIRDVIVKNDRVVDDRLSYILYGETNSIKTFLLESIRDYYTDRSLENLIFVAALFGSKYNGPLYHKQLKFIHNTSQYVVLEESVDSIIRGEYVLEKNL